jgi:hypothetical protein
MDRVFEIQRLLNKVVEELTDVLNTPVNDSLSPEECIQLAFEIVTNEESEPRVYSPLVAEIDKESVVFVIDEEFQIPLYMEEPYDYED